MNFHWCSPGHDASAPRPATRRETMKQAKILIADDEAAITTGLSAILEDAGYAVEVVADGQKALDTLTADRYGVVLADLKMPKLDGLALLRELQQRQIMTEAIIITGQATVDSAVQAMQQGAYDYIEKPLNAEKLNRLKALIPKALDKYQVQQKNRELASKLEGLTHYGELSGHEKGAFTGSINEKPGAFEMASGGTIFLDEMAEMPPDIQVKLLRAIETRQVRRLGGKKEINVDIRIVAATNKNLQKAIVDGELREDLYYRLAVVEIDLPPLRERADDIQLLANEFLARFSQQNGKTITGFEDAAWEWIMSYHWPGNVRELKNAVERAVIMSRNPTIGPEDIIPRHLRGSGEMPAALTIPVGATAAEARRQLVLRTFASTSGDAARTAKVLGLSEEDVRAELLTLLNGAGDASSAPAPADNGADLSAPRAARRQEPVATPARAASKKPSSK